MTIAIDKLLVDEELEDFAEEIAREKSMTLTELASYAFIRYLEDEEDRRAIKEYEKNPDKETVSFEEFMEEVYGDEE